MDTIAKIRRAFFVEKKPIKAICRELKRSRTAVRRAIRSEATGFRYERSIQPMPKLGFVLTGTFAPIACFISAFRRSSGFSSGA